jgi:hypothetical protein
MIAQSWADNSHVVAPQNAGGSEASAQRHINAASTWTQLLG